MFTSTNHQKPVDPPSQDVTHVYCRQHNCKGLQCKWRGPFEIDSRPTRSTVKIKVGVNKDSSDRTEIRSWGDAKSAYLRDNMAAASRPKRGRPRKPTTVVPGQEESPSTNIEEDPPFHGFNSQVAATTFSVPPPNLSIPPPWIHADPSSVAKVSASSSWSASKDELEAINASISSRRV